MYRHRHCGMLQRVVYLKVKVTDKTEMDQPGLSKQITAFMVFFEGELVISKTAFKKKLFMLLRAGYPLIIEVHYPRIHKEG